MLPIAILTPQAAAAGPANLLAVAGDPTAAATQAADGTGAAPLFAMLLPEAGADPGVLLAAVVPAAPASDPALTGFPQVPQVVLDAADGGAPEDDATLLALLASLMPQPQPQPDAAQATLPALEGSADPATEAWAVAGPALWSADLAAPVADPSAAGTIAPRSDAVPAHPAQVAPLVGGLPGTVTTGDGSDAAMPPPSAVVTGPAMPPAIATAAPERRAVLTPQVTTAILAASATQDVASAPVAAADDAVLAPPADSPALAMSVASLRPAAVRQPASAPVPSAAVADAAVADPVAQTAAAAADPVSAMAG
ncbi:MAG: hypothetical protein J0M02_11520, partial [Planctomycetes bacterium]|nr:hypothetical protein [Planctomycetota bacterium]